MTLAIDSRRTYFMSLGAILATFGGRNLSAEVPTSLTGRVYGV